MTNHLWTPWHKVVSIRPDLRSGELSLASFAADLYDVAMQHGERPAYEDPAEFFALTYPTYNLRELAREVAFRLAGKNDKAVRQLALTYGGGKTHTLITLFHLANNPGRLPKNLPAVQEFLSEIAIPLPKARVAALTFDKLDVEKGMNTRAPNGETRWLRNPWSLLAYQLAGTDGLRLLHADGLDEERESAPAENLLSDLLALPQKEGLSTLILLDEVLMFAREKIGLDPAWRDRLVNFFQYLTQAVTRVDCACLVASLLATDPRKSDYLGKQITQEMEAIFARQREESIQPVVKDDVAEVLRRRLFTASSIVDREAFRPHVVAALKGIEALDPQTEQEGAAAEERYLRSYPFHPDLTEVFYSKWANLEGFQRTRGVLRTFALALREAEKWDTSPLISTNAFLSHPGSAGISEAGRELAQIATAEEYEGRTPQWSPILQSELEKAIDVQNEFSSLHGREMEAAVFAVFLNSQPIVQRIQTRELQLLIGHTRPDRIELEKALLRWTEISWFLDDTLTQEAEKSGTESASLPKAWRLGSKPNLTQMHHDAIRFRVSPEAVEMRLLEEIGKLKSLTAGVSSQGVKIHNLPEWPKQVEDDANFHYVILSPKAACSAGNPSAEAKRFINETTAADRPRVYRNAIVIATPSVEGLEAARTAIQKHIGWLEVHDQLKNQVVESVRAATLLQNIQATGKAIPDTIRQAYSIAITVDESNVIQAYRIAPSGDPLFTAIKKDGRVRIQETAVSAEALLPGGPYELWREGDEARRFKDLSTAFAQFPHLPKMLDRQAILDTLVNGCKVGTFVLRLPRPDKSYRTFWRQTPDDAALKDPALEVVLPEHASLSEISPELLEENRLPGLWTTAGQIKVQEIYDYFSGEHVVQIQKEGYEEPLPISKAEREVVDAAIAEGVKRGRLWLLLGPASIFAEEIPAGLLMPDALLLPPPAKLSVFDLLPERLPEVWSDGAVSVLALATAISNKLGRQVPWKVIREALDGAYSAHYLERTVDSKPWPCDFGDAQWIKVKIPVEAPTPTVVVPHPQKPPQPANMLWAEKVLGSSQIQDLSEVMAKLLKATAGAEIRFVVRIEISGKISGEMKDQVNQVLGEVDSHLIIT